MKILRIIGIGLFLLSTVAFVGYKGVEYNNKDEFGPEIIFEDIALSVSASSTSEEFLEGVTAFDEHDGDVTNSLFIEKISKFAGKGKRIITYAAFDSKGNVSKMDREITYTDYMSPRFSLSKPLRFKAGEDNILQFMTAQDSIDGDLSDKIRYENPEFGYSLTDGVYYITFQVTNSAGDTANLPAEVEFYYPSNVSHNPEILLSQYIIYSKVGDDVNALSYIKGVKIEGKEYSYMSVKDKVKMSSNINNQEPGIYNIEYSMQTDEGYKGTTKLLVVVEE